MFNECHMRLRPSAGDIYSDHAVPPHNGAPDEAKIR